MTTSDIQRKYAWDTPENNHQSLVRISNTLTLHYSIFTTESNRGGTIQGATQQDFGASPCQRSSALAQKGAHFRG
eukprot:3253979-Amphidinium_carterae.1